MITIVDNGPGNHQSLVTLLRKLGVRHVTISSDPKAILEAKALVLPGVGNFSRAASALDEKGLREPLARAVLENGTPFLGICVGMQLLSSASEEGPGRGLGWIAGTVARLDAGPALRLPHMGWNWVAPRSGSRLFEGLERPLRFYFVHSYHLTGAPASAVAATTDYGGPFVSAVASGNIFGVQFHVERSHRFGLALMKRFLAIAEAA